MCLFFIVREDAFFIYMRSCHLQKSLRKQNFLKNFKLKDLYMYSNYLLEIHEQYIIALVA